MIINPRIIPGCPCHRVLEHLSRTTIRTPLTPRQHRLHRARRSRTRVPPGAITAKLGLQRHAGRIARDATGDPIDETGGQDAVIHIGIGEDGAHLGIPGPAEGAPALDGQGGVGLLHGGVDDVDAEFVGVGGVGAFPGGDAAAARAQRDQAVVDPAGAEAVEEVGLSGHFAVFDEGVAELTDVDLCRRVGLVGEREERGGGGTVSW